ncbi:hypothetical protein WJ41_28790 [Burkholderia ubonensis]|uniref:hypothetical protein n=1 Tax=Burkholderia TaxID=32008 RepID=UPI0005AC8553|nr:MULTISPECIES: hypothetical protein [Burkholderia]KIP17236.1 hypothetical protein KY49_6877 [Burkholderia sp. MSHR3999]KVD52838.1 hypothetical protein WI87_26290 [Burkholderia ubonensis]KVG83975.1 hypothetical protein WJ36_01685 [Burkholderia ubonensis]KVH81271.1 hypothetical protein WJ41_28790 [Burkholderia ubonensis]KVR04349.1 hypothetical protein WK09_29555 [Burkholderia ubonensis]
MEDSASIAPMAIARPLGAHRFEAFSPKLARRVTFFRRPALEQWLVIEADPTARTFCERPGCVMLDGQRYLADFWVRYADRQELITLFDPMAIPADKGAAVIANPTKPITVRRIEPAELAASRMWVENWQRMLPCLIAARGLIADPLLDDIVRFVALPQPLLAIEREFSTGDSMLVRAAVFGLLHAGRIQSPALHLEALSLLTSFVASETVS